MTRYSERGGFYRSRDGMIFGVCRGVAQYFDLSLFWVRIAFVAGFLFSGFFPVGVLYIFMALLMKKEPYWRTIY